jgi:anti-sigma B factor antagonist
MDDPRTGGFGASDIPPFDMRVDRRGMTAILRLWGEFDIVGAEQVDACIKGLAGNSPNEVVIDLSGVSFMDSTALRSLIKARALGSEAGWSLKLVRGPERVHRVLELTRMDEAFEFVDAPPGD